ncbi:MFS transporter [Micromonospora coxensis]|uniref:Major Facilitator Superfamily protein n=1 Tax=Micromonospora coxensis TaxID=356852 RepID=A0A1C5JVQ7_9ACTN|nr:MFS transporter [Micromonospora coxensis]SCG74664.1 Major Facilitator Superfamily protein [Micromonospora coxensis]
MRATVPAPADPTVDGRRAHAWRLVAALAVTQTVGYGTLYYAFPVLLRPMAATLGASATTVTGALTVSVLGGALMAVPVGRWLDRHGGRALMTVGSVAATALLLAWSQVRTVGQLYAVLVAIGVTGAMVLYEPAFAVVVSWFGPDRRPTALLVVTLVAGFASTVFMPLTGLLEAHLGWRGALLVLAAVHGAVTVPLHALTVRRPRSGHPTGRTGRADDADRRALVVTAMRDARFRILAAALTAHGVATSVMTVHLVGYLVSRGHPPTVAAATAGLLGVLSVTGRLVLAGARRRVPVATVVAVVFGVQAVAVAALPWLAGSRAGAVVGVVGFGLGFGVASLATPALLADRYGATAYASIAGRLAAAVTVAKAVAPVAAATALGGPGGYPLLLAVVAACCAVAAVGMLARAGSPSPVGPGPSG